MEQILGRGRLGYVVNAPFTTRFLNNMTSELKIHN